MVTLSSKSIGYFFGVLQNVDWDERKKEMTDFRREFDELQRLKL